METRTDQHRSNNEYFRLEANEGNSLPGSNCNGNIKEIFLGPKQKQLYYFHNTPMVKNYN